MKLLLDTHTLLWFLEGNQRLSNEARKQIEDLSNDRLVSVASVWGIAIKVSIGRLKFPATDVASLESIFCR